MAQKVTNLVTFTEFPNMGSLYKKKKGMNFPLSWRLESPKLEEKRGRFSFQIIVAFCFQIVFIWFLNVT